MGAPATRSTLGVWPEFGRSFAGVHQNLANYQFLTQIMFAFQ
jgi:hypothetical protein